MNRFARKCTAMLLGLLVTFAMVNPLMPQDVQTPDTEPPVIHLDTLTVVPTEGTTGDTITYSVKVTDNVEVSYVSIELVNLEDTQTRHFVTVSKDPNSDTWTGSIAIDETYDAGSWAIHAIYAADNYENNDSGANYFRYNNAETHDEGIEDSDNVKHVTFPAESVITLTGVGVYDTTSPIVHLDSITVSPSPSQRIIDATATDETQRTITMSVRVEDPESSIHNGYFELSPEGSYEPSMKTIAIFAYPDENDPNLLVGTAIVDSSTPPGEYSVSLIEANNDTVYEPHKTTYKTSVFGSQTFRADQYDATKEPYHKLADLSAYKVEIENPSYDSLAPVVDLAFLDAEPQAVMSGNAVLISLKAKDVAGEGITPVGIQSVYVAYLSPETNTYVNVLLEEDPANPGLYKFERTTDTSTENGTWYADNIYLTDKNGNSYYINRYSATDEEEVAY